MKPGNIPGKDLCALAKIYRHFTGFMISISFLIITAMVFAAGKPALAWEQQGSLDQLFASPLAAPVNAAQNTFVFWINGDADHFVPSSTDSGTSLNVYRGDKFEVARLEQLAQSCSACNVVILHDQRGTDHWYSASKPWAVWFQVYSRGRKLLERHAPEVDETDPMVLARLLSFSQSSFPQSELHLIYRGHSFRTPYVPGSLNILPFDYSNPEHGYSQGVFLRSLQLAHLSKPLGSVNFTSCSMSSFEFAAKLQKYARFFTASEVELLEVLSASVHFFDVLTLVNDRMDNRQVSWLLAFGIPQAFKKLNPAGDAMMEAPSTWVDLSGARLLAEQFNILIQALDNLPQNRRDFMRGQLEQSTRLTKAPSDAEVENLRKQGKTDAQISQFIRLLSQPSPDLNDLDLGLVLLLIGTWDESSELHELANWLFERAFDYVRVLGGSTAPGSGKLGLSISYRTEAGAMFDRL